MQLTKSSKEDIHLKKSPKADLENKRMVFLQIGLIVTLAIVLLAFEWKSYDRVSKDVFTSGPSVDIPEELVPITEQKAPPPPPPPPAPSVQLNIVDNTTVITSDIRIDAEVDDKTEIEEYIAPPPAPVTTIKHEEAVAEAEIFIVVEESAEFPGGGDAARIKFLQDNLVYPQMAKENGIQGKVYTTFVVERDGSITDIKILRGIGGGCDEEAIRVIKLMPKWKPGKQRGKPVRQQFNLPIEFVLAG